MIFKSVSCWILKNINGLHKTVRTFSCNNSRAMQFIQYKLGGQLGILLNDGRQIVSLSDANKIFLLTWYHF